MSNRKTKEQFIEKAIEIHGDKYDYSKVDYVNSKTKIIIICKEHGDFLQRPSEHLCMNGCSKCGKVYKKNTEEFIKKAIEIHGDKYDYSKVVYKKARDYINIICKEHGEFTQWADSHLRGYGCKKCAGLFLDTKEFIERSKKIHGDEYDYSKVEYTNSITKIIIICKKHGDFLQTPNNHLQGGCKKCSNEYNYTNNSRRSNKENFIKIATEIHGDKYDYSKVNYKNNNIPIIIICKEHGEFLQGAKVHCNGHGCKKCAVILASDKRKFTTEEVIQMAKEKHKDKYDYSKVEYTNSITKIIIICKKHGDFLQTPDSHIRGSGCSLCTNKTEGLLFEKLQLIYPTIITQFKEEWCKKVSYLPFDFCIPDYNIIIELDGIQHFQQVRDWKTPEEQFQTDKYKEKRANENGYSIIRLLQEDVFYDKYDWYEELCDTIEEIIKNKVIKNYYLCKNDEYKNYY
jgi:very-short-patch-repair endonuclease